MPSDDGLVEADVAMAAPTPAPMPKADAPVQAARPLPSTPVQPIDLSSVSLEGESDLDRQWHSQVMQLCQQGLVAALVRELAMQARCLSHEPAAAGQPARWVLQVERESLCTDANRDRLQGALATLVGGEATLQIDRGRVACTPAMKEQAIREARQMAAQQLIEHDPMVVDLLAQFPGAQIVSGSIRPL